MPDFRIRIRLRGPLGTPLTSGGIFGQFCWSLLMAEGEPALECLLKNFAESPLIFSDAFPADTVPVPILPPERPGRPEKIAEGDAAKKQSRRPVLPIQAFLARRHAWNRAGLHAAFASAQPTRGLSERRTAHNTINRHTNTTPESGGLYFADEDWPPGEGMDLDIYARGELGPDRLRPLFREIGDHGFGKDASTGRGRFEVLSVEPVAGLREGGGRWVSWSRGCRSEGMTDTRYRIYTHYGKLGGPGMHGSNPFKFPLTLWKPGATFAGCASGAFGRLLRNVHPDRPEIVHNAMHFTVGYTEAA